MNEYFRKYILRNIYIYIVYDEFKYRIKRDLTTQCKSLMYVFVAKTLALSGRRRNRNKTKERTNEVHENTYAKLVYGTKDTRLTGTTVVGELNKTAALVRLYSLDDLRQQTMRIT